MLLKGRGREKGMGRRRVTASHARRHPKPEMRSREATPDATTPKVRSVIPASPASTYARTTCVESARTEQSAHVGAARLAVSFLPRRVAVAGRNVLSRTSSQAAPSKSRKASPSPTTKNPRGRIGTIAVSPVPIKTLPPPEVVTARRMAAVGRPLPNRPAIEVVWFGLRDC